MGLIFYIIALFTDNNNGDHQLIKSCIKKIIVENLDGKRKLRRNLETGTSSNWDEGEQRFKKPVRSQLFAYFYQISKIIKTTS